MCRSLIACILLLGVLNQSFISSAPPPPGEHSTEQPWRTTYADEIQDAYRSTSDNNAKSGCPCSSLANSTATVGQPDRQEQRQQHFERLYSRHMLVHGLTCMCNVPLAGFTTRDDYHYSSISGHKLHTRAVTWNDARKICNEEGGHLAIINSIVEEHILMELFNQSGPIKGAAYPDEAFLGIHDLYEEGDWVTVLGNSLAKTGYTRWSDKWGGQPDNGGNKQHCGALMKDGGMDDVACDVPFPFFCELPSMQVLQ